MIRGYNLHTQVHEKMQIENLDYIDVVVWRYLMCGWIAKKENEYLLWEIEMKDSNNKKTFITKTVRSDVQWDTKIDLNSWAFICIFIDYDLKWLSYMVKSNIYGWCKAYHTIFIYWNFKLRKHMFCHLEFRIRNCA